MLLAAGVFPEGVHSDFATLWLILTFILTAALLALVAFALWRWWNKRQRLTADLKM
jgi:hypothetical protein